MDRHADGSIGRTHRGHLRLRLREFIGAYPLHQHDPANRHHEHRRGERELHEEPMGTSSLATIEPLNDLGMQSWTHVNVISKDGSVMTKARLQLRVFGDHASTPCTVSVPAIARRNFASARCTMTRAFSSVTPSVDAVSAKERSSK